MIVSYFIYFALYLCLVQADLEVLFEDGGCVRSNDDYIKPDSCLMDVDQDSEYGTSLSTSIEIIKKMKSVIALASVFGMERDGEYTVDFGVRLVVNVCESLSGPTTSIVFPILKAMNLPSDPCPPEPGVYGNDHFVMEEGNSDGLPDSFPPGKYLLNLTLLLDDVELLVEYGIYLTVL
ncbi:uncharacterized protein LOC144470104 [Augochlora pura]